MDGRGDACPGRQFRSATRRSPPNVGPMRSDLMSRGSRNGTVRLPTPFPTVDYTASIATGKGDIVIALDAERAPLATNNFICLARAGYYDGTDFHRIAADFLIQGETRPAPASEVRGTPFHPIPPQLLIRRARSHSQIRVQIKMGRSSSLPPQT